MRSLERIVAVLPWCSSVCLACIVITWCTIARISVYGCVRSTMFWAHWQQSMSTYSQPFFPSSTWNRGGVWIYGKCKL